MRYIHEDCLKQWLNTSREVKETPISYSYFWKALECDLCKTVFPEILMHQGKKISVIDFHIPTGVPYLILEGTSK
jgi:E3 ubiquitin-protein ligase DOA10